MIRVRGLTVYFLEKVAKLFFQVPQARDMAFLDSSSNMEEFSLRVFLMVTHSVVGALPLEIIITSDETTETLNGAIRLFKASLPANAFYGNGPGMGPKVMTDNCSELRAALNTQWPNTVVVLCIFHILQQVWRWLHDKKNAIILAERQHLLLCFKECPLRKK